MSSGLAPISEQTPGVPGSSPVLLAGYKPAPIVLVEGAPLLRCTLWVVGGSWAFPKPHIQRPLLYVLPNLPGHMCVMLLRCAMRISCQGICV